MKKSNSGSKFWLVTGAVLAATSVGLGAFGAHGLEGFVENRGEDPARSLENWETASRYLMYHALGFLVLGFAVCMFEKRTMFHIAGCLFALGITLFSGCLYILVLTEMKFLGAIVPLGGLSMIAGWILLAIGMTTARLNDNRTEV